MQREFHIAFGVDAIYAPKMCVTIASILENNKNNKIIFHVLYNDLNNTLIDEIKKSVAIQNGSILFHFVDTDLSKFPKFTHFLHITTSAFLRFYIPQLLKGVTNKVLYLDADILCMNDISDIFQIEMKENEILAVVEDPISHAYIKKLSPFLKHYFNSGVLMIDVEKWNKHSVLEKLLTILNEKGNCFNLVDQDALNLVMHEKVRYLDNGWNYMFNADHMEKTNAIYSVPEDVKFIHFIGPLKPRHFINNFDEITDLFLYYQKKTIWSGLDMPQNYKEMRRYARKAFKKGKYLTCFLWEFRYLKTKFF